MQIYIDGKFCSKEEATISVFDHGLLYGDGIFEGVRFYGKKLFCLEAHVKRLYQSAKALQLTIPLESEKLQKTIHECVERNDLADGYIRIVVTRGKGSLGLSPKSCSQASLIIIVGEIALYSPEAYETGLSIITCATRRMTHGALSPQIKSLNYLNNILAKQETLRAGVEEGLMLNEQGFVSECTADNIFIVREEKVVTPSLDAGALAGITRSVVIDLARSLGLKVEEALLTCYDIYTADECFLTGTAAEIIPVVKLDEKSIGAGVPGPVTKRLIQTFKALVAA